MIQRKICFVHARVGLRDERKILRQNPLNDVYKCAKYVKVD